MNANEVWANSRSTRLWKHRKGVSPRHCEMMLFKSEIKFEDGTGGPSFYLRRGTVIPKPRRRIRSSAGVLRAVRWPLDHVFKDAGP